MPTENKAKPGMEEADKWKPYKLWMGDKWKCEGCGTEIISGTGFRPIAEHFQPEFAGRVADYAANYQVNDC